MNKKVTGCLIGLTGKLGNWAKEISKKKKKKSGLLNAKKCIQNATQRMDYSVVVSATDRLVSPKGNIKKSITLLNWNEFPNSFLF